MTLKADRSHIPEEADVEQPLEKPDGFYRHIVRKLEWRLRWLFPNFEFTQHRDTAEYYRKSDHEENLASVIPDAEDLRIGVVWAAEVYGPSETEKLCENLARLKWSAGFGARKRAGAAEWVSSQRSYGHGGWYNVGLVANPNSKNKYFMPKNEMRLPEGVECLQVQIFQITPALTCVVIGFVLSEATSSIYQSVSKKYRRAYWKRSSRAELTRVRPDDLKRLSVVESRETVRNIAKAWFLSNLPGYFCGADVHRLPTAELITTSEEPLLDVREVGFDDRKSWKDLIVTAPAYEIWSGSEGSGVRFVSERGGIRGEPPHMVVSLCKSEVSNEASLDRGGVSDSSYLFHAIEAMAPVIGNFASISYLTETLKNLRESRASLVLKRVSSNEGLLALERIQAFFDQSLGTPAIASELKKRSEHKENFSYNCEGFSASNWRPGAAPRSLATELCNRTNALASQIIIEEHSLREHLEQLSSIISVRESIRVQRRMEMLTISALAVAVISMVIAVTQNSDWSKAISAFASKLFSG